ncbi:MAG: ATPase [Bacteroidia bacterium]
MDTPFVYGRLADGIEFTNREKETLQLSQNFQSRINTILISPRRWGKSSLVARAALAANRKDKNIKFCFIDLFSVRTEEDFYKTLSQELIKATASQPMEMMTNVRKFFRHFIPKITFNPEPNSELSLGLDWNDVKKQPDEILDMPETIAKSQKIKLIICIDEFQNISTFEHQLAFQKKCRAHWQKHQHVAYCLYGSKRHMMMEVFASPDMPFYKYGDLIFLEKIEMKHWIPFIIKRFNDTGKKIKPELAELIVNHADHHPYYVQQIAQLSWLRTGKLWCDKATIEEAVEALMMQLSLLFQTITDGLSNTQINFLKAVLEGAQQISSKENLHKYNLGTSGNINRVRQALVNKEIIDVLNSKIAFQDPMYKRWLQEYYFNTA